MTQIQPNNQKEFLILLEMATQMRLEMSRLEQLSVPNCVSNSCRKRWQEEVIQPFGENENIVRHFFGFAILLPGHMDENEPIMVIYNPWVDIALLTWWRNTTTEKSVINFRFVPGELLRDEHLAENPVLPPWFSKEGKSLEEVIAKQCSKTIHQLEKYALSKYVPETFQSSKKILAKTSPPREVGMEELMVIAHGRMLFRVGYQEKHLSEKVSLLISETSGLIRKLLVDNNKDELFGQLGKDQDQYSAETAMMLPEQVKASLVPQFSVTDGDRLIIFMGSPVAPRYFMSIRIPLQEKDKWGFFLYDFNVEPDVDK